MIWNLCAGQPGLLAKAHVPEERLAMQQANVLLALQAAEVAGQQLPGSFPALPDGQDGQAAAGPTTLAARAAAVVQGSQQGTLHELWRLFCSLQVGLQRM